MATQQVLPWVTCRWGSTSACSSPVTGWTIDEFGYSWMWAVVATCMAIGAAISYAVREEFAQGLRGTDCVGRIATHQLGLQILGFDRVSRELLGLFAGGKVNPQSFDGLVDGETDTCVGVDSLGVVAVELRFPRKREADGIVGVGRKHGATIGDARRCRRSRVRTKVVSGRPGFIEPSARPAAPHAAA